MSKYGYGAMVPPPNGPDFTDVQFVSQVYQSFVAACLSGHFDAEFPEGVGKGMFRTRPNGDDIELCLYDGVQERVVTKFLTANGNFDCSPLLATLADAKAGGGNGLMSSALVKAQLDARESALVAVVAEHVISDGTEYSTGSQSLTMFREFVIPETVPDSRLIVSFDCQMLPTGGDNGDAGQLNDLFCTDAAGVVWVVDGQNLHAEAHVLKTSNATSSNTSVYGVFSRTLPELPNFAKIDLTPFGIEANGWRLIARHREYYNSTARTKQLRLRYREIANAN